MRNNYRNVRINERQAGNRKRNQFIIRLILIVIVVIFVLFFFGIRDIKAELKEMRNMLERIEILQYGRKDAPVAAVASVEGVSRTEDYASSVAMESVEKPVQRTAEEAVKRLQELAQTDPVIEGICRNTSLYPESMLMALANNPEMADFVAGYLNDGTVTGGLTDAEKEQDFPLLLQWDPRWGYQTYGDSCVGVAGCGPTCLSMVMLYLTGDEMLMPDVIANYAMEKGYYVNGTGTAWALIDSFPIWYGIEVSETKVTERAIKSELDKGKVLICAMGQGDFTVSGHFIVIYGHDDSGFQVNDPNCVARSRKEWTFEEIKDQIKKIWAYEEGGK